MDLASSEGDESGLACPPVKFATRVAIELARRCLRSNGLPRRRLAALQTPLAGVFSMNLVTRDEELLGKIKADIVSVFPHSYVISEEEDVNEVIVCPLHHYEKQFLKRLPKKELTERWRISYIDMLHKLTPIAPNK